MLRFHPLTDITMCHMCDNILLHTVPSIFLLQILVHFGTTRVNRIGQVMGLRQYSFSEIVYLGDTYSVFEPDCALTILCEV
jgi:hypothetical protein